MKSIRLFLMIMGLCLLGVVNVVAQEEDEKKYTITGHLLDADLKEPLDLVTIQLFWVTDSAFVGGTLSSEDGNFSVEAPSSGTYRLRFTYIGFQRLEREITLRKNQLRMDLGNILLAPDAKLMKEAVVAAQAAQVVVKKDTLVYNPDAYRTPEGSPIEELIKRMPGAEVDDDGNITINGKKIEKILIDGKEFMLGDVETALKNLPVAIIQNVKFYDQQSDQARITGIEDGNKQTVLDFTIKKGMNRGYMTNLDLAGGTEHRYASRGMGSSFTDKTRFVVMGNFNNKEENAGWWNRRGLNANKMLSSATFSDDPYLYADDPLALLHEPSATLYPYFVNHNHGASLSYGENRNAWAMLQFYRRLNPRGRNVTLRVEGNIGDSKNRNASNNEVYLHRMKNQAGQDSTYYTARYNTTPGDYSRWIQLQHRYRQCRTLQHGLRHASAIQQLCGLRGTDPLRRTGEHHPHDQREPAPERQLPQ